MHTHAWEERIGLRPYLFFFLEECGGIPFGVVLGELLWNWRTKFTDLTLEATLSLYCKFDACFQTLAEGKGEGTQAYNEH